MILLNHEPELMIEVVDLDNALNTQTMCLDC